MSETTRLFVAPIAAAILSLVFVPVARAIAIRTGFFDHPAGYKAHGRPTPYLGGVAVVGAFVVAAAIAGALDGWLTLTTCVILLSLVGTADDRVNLPIGIRLAVQIGTAIALWEAGLGWALFAGDALNLAITIGWVVGIVNAFNLMDNQDGATASVAASCAIGVGLLAQLHGDEVVAALALSLAGACIAFLPYNLAKPSKIFLGDGGSTPVGLVVATLIMAAPWRSTEWSDVLVGVLLAGIPILDTALVVASRYRRRAAILSGARDHITHRLLAALRTPTRVALALACAQAALCGLALALYELGPAQIALASALYFAMGAVAIFMLDHPRWPPGATARREQSVTTGRGRMAEEPSA